MKGSHTGFRLFLITCWSRNTLHTKQSDKNALTAVDETEEGARRPDLSPVHKLFGFIVIDSVYFQKWVRLAEEILQKQRKQNMKAKEKRRT